MTRPRGHSSSAARDEGVRLSAGDAPAIEADPAADALPADLLDDQEIIVLLLRPSAWFILLGSLGSVMILLILTLALALLAVKLSAIPWNESQAYILGSTAVIARLAWQLAEWLNCLYVLTDRRVLARSGVLRTVQFQAALGDISHTTVFARLREKAIGLGSIGFATRESTIFNGYWLMVRRPFEVHRIVGETIKRYGRK